MQGFKLTHVSKRDPGCLYTDMYIFHCIPLILTGAKCVTTNHSHPFFIIYIIYNRCRCPKVNITWSYIQNCSGSIITSTKICTHTRHPISRLHGWASWCLFWWFSRKLTSLQRHCTVYIQRDGEFIVVMILQGTFCIWAMSGDVTV